MTTHDDLAAYAGDVTSREAWELLHEDARAILVDVRTEPEWQFVGLPDVSGLSRPLIRVSWQVYPAMNVNSAFVDAVRAEGVDDDAPVFLICRSGQRSRHAAIALTAAGFSRCYNVADGFEGPLDGLGHRGGAAGWKAAGLPWRQS